MSGSEKRLGFDSPDTKPSSAFGNTMKPSRRKFRDNRRGAATVEFALIAPLLFFLIFMMFEASRFLMGLHATTGAAREAVRSFAIQGDETTARLVAVQYLRSSSFDVDEVKVDFTTSPSGIAGMENIECSIEIDFKDVSLVGDPFNLGAEHVRGFSAMMAAQ